MPTDDLRLNQIRDAFLQEVEQWHAEHEFVNDYTALAGRLGVTVVSGHSNQAITAREGRFIVVDERAAVNRARFSGLHEVAHHLFEEAAEGELRAQLRDILYDAPGAAQQYEEELCDAAAALLLMPTHALQKSVTAHSHSPLAVLFLKEHCGASVQAAARRVIWHHDVPSFCVLLRMDGMVVDSVGHGHARAYTVGRNFVVEPEHPLRAATFLPGKLEEFDAAVPFRSGTRGWSMRVRACHDGNGRILAFFNEARHITRTDHRQPSLF